MQKTTIARKIGGISTPRFVIPIAIVLALLHASIIFSIISINRISGHMSSIMAQYGQYINEVMEMQGGSSFLSESSFSFLFHPVIQKGEESELNSGPLVAYATELSNERRGDDILGKFRTYDVDPQVVAYLEDAAAAANGMIDVQTHAIELIRSVYGFPPIPQLEVLPRYELTAEELAYSDEQKLDVVYDLVTGTEYSNYKRIVSENLSTCSNVLRAEMEVKSGVQVTALSDARKVLWVMTVLTMATLVYVLFFAITQIVRPLHEHVAGIETGSYIDNRKGLHEVRVLASRYNELLDNKAKLEDFLRSTAETDALTDLPNRYYFEQYMAKTGESGPVALLLFDVNFLKDTNDREGHLAGDKLLKRTANCISKCFGTLPESKCFRYGGDEFAAIIKSACKKKIDERLVEFAACQKDNDVSIATGFAFTNDIASTDYHALFLEADKDLYVQKENMHKAARKTESLFPRWADR